MNADPADREATRERALARARTLLAPDPTLGVPRPAYDGRSLPNLAETLCRAASPDGSAPGSMPVLSPEVAPWAGVPSDGPTVLFVIDGLGWLDFSRWAEERADPRGAAWGASAAPITTVFPSTTTSALFSLATGVAPGQHGLLGYRQYLPRYGVLADMLKLSPAGVEARDLLVGPTWTPADLGAPPTLSRRGARSVAMTRDRFLGTGFTRLLYDGSRVVGYATATDLADELERLLENDPPPLLTVYWDELDTIQHLKGPQPRLFDLELERTIHLIEHVASSIPASLARSTRLVVTGDHGQVPAHPDAALSIDRIPEIAGELRHPPSGDRRSAFLSARPGRLDALRSAVERHCPPGTRILETRPAVAAGLFGPPPFHPEIDERLGELIVLPPSPATISYRWPGVPPPPRFLVGAHGGLEPAEFLVPLASLRFSDLRRERATAGSKR